MNRMPAFTLLEVIVALLLFGLIGGLAFLSMNGMHSGLQQTSLTVTQEQELLWFSQAVQQDMRSADTVIKEEGGITRFYTSGTSISYLVHADSVIRSDGKRRSAFFLPNAESKITFHPQVSDLVERWTLTATTDGTTRPLHFQKEYSTEQLMQYQQRHGH